MPKRYHCEFKDCFCTKFKLHCKNLCLHCKHANIWHARKKRSVTGTQERFVSSTRISAHSPTYERVSIGIEIFIPEVLDLPIAEEVIYCPNIDVLPV